MPKRLGYLSGSMLAQPDLLLPTDSLCLIGGVHLLLKDVMSGDIRPQIINLFDGTHAPLTKEDITILLQAIYRAEHNPLSDKLTSDRVITRLNQDIFFSEAREKQVSNIIYSTELEPSDGKHVKTTVRMDIFDTDGNPRDEIIDSIYRLLQNPEIGIMRKPKHEPLAFISD